MVFGEVLDDIPELAEEIEQGNWLYISSQGSRAAWEDMAFFAGQQERISVGGWRQPSRAGERSAGFATWSTATRSCPKHGASSAANGPRAGRWSG